MQFGEDANAERKEQRCQSQQEEDPCHRPGLLGPYSHGVRVPALVTLHVLDVLDDFSCQSVQHPYSKHRPSALVVRLEHAGCTEQNDHPHREADGDVARKPPLLEPQAV